MAARKRELIEPHKGDKRYVRRNKKGEFKEVVDVGRSLAADRRQQVEDRRPRRARATRAIARRRRRGCQRSR